MENTTMVEIAAKVTSVNDSLVAWEKATANLKGIDENAKIKELKESLKKARKPYQKAQKDALDRVEKELAGMKDANAACIVANSLHQTPEGADDVTRQRFSRRRSKLASLLETAYPDYEVIKLRDNKSKRVTFKANWIGSLEERQAKEILAVLKKYGERFQAGELDRETLANELKADSGTKIVSAPVTATANTQSIVEGIFNNIGLTVAEEKLATKETKTRKQANG